MIFGICSKSPIDFQNYLSKYSGKQPIQSLNQGNCGFAFMPDANFSTRHSGVWQDENSKNWFVFQGHIFNEKQLRQEHQVSSSLPFSQLVMELVHKNGTEIFQQFNGHFAVAIYDDKTRQLTLVRDHFGAEPLYYYSDQNSIIFTSNPLILLQHNFIPKELNYKGLHTYFLFNYIPLRETIIANLYKLRPAHSLTWQNGEVQQQRFWFLSFQQQDNKPESYYTENILDLLRDAVAIRLDNGKSGSFLSGGMDSSSIVGLAAPILNQKLHTFSFRCKGESFDESHYAQFMSDAYNTQHHLVEFPSDEVNSIDNLTAIMPEPFCDIGIEIASFLLAKYAHGKVDYILSGDGGDELFAGHPVYIADKVARYFDLVPRFVQRPITGMLQWLHDTDQKKSLVVKAKRFSYSAGFPSSLFSNRWRIYYTQKELQRAVEKDVWNHIQNTNPLTDIEQFYREADGQDYLSQTLYGDYATVVNFYLTRLSILKQYGIEARMPMFDYRLVEFAATIPSDLKIKGNNDTKYILKKTMTGVLPDEIVFRKDKLGHSVPMKNWMRDSDQIRSFIQDILSEENLKKRGLFKPGFVQKMLDDHTSKKFNHSHRIWALLVLELWLQKHFDTRQ